MKNYRIPRLQAELKKLFNIALSQKLNDPKLAWVQITDVVISKDLHYAKLYFSHYNNPASHDQIRELLIKSSGFLKKQIAGAQIMRTIPELSFYYDDTEDRAAKVDTLLAWRTTKRITTITKTKKRMRKRNNFAISHKLTII